MWLRAWVARVAVIKLSSWSELSPRVRRQLDLYHHYKTTLYTTCIYFSLRNFKVNVKRQSRKLICVLIEARLTPTQQSSCEHHHHHITRTS